MRAVIAAGIRVFVTACFRGTRTDERRIKNGACTARCCPLCRAEYRRRARERMRSRRELKRKLDHLLRRHRDCDCIACLPP